MPQDTATILKDPNFHALSPEERIKVLDTVDANFLGLPTGEKMKVVTALGGGPQLTPVQTAAMKREKIPLNPSPTFLAGQKQVLASEFEKARPQSTVGTRAREAAIGALEPFTLGNMLGAITQAGSAAKEMFINENPIPALEMAVGAVKAPFQPLSEMYQGIKTGDYDRAAGGAGGFLSTTVPAIEGGVKIVKKTLPLDALRNQSRQIAQDVTGVGSRKTTTKIVEKYSTEAADAAARQATSDAAIADRNQAAVTTAAEKTADKAAEFAQKEAERAAGHQEKLAEFQEKETGKIDEFKKSAEETMKANREALHAASRDAAVTRSIDEGSKVLGERVADLDSKLRQEGNAKYDVVKKTTMRKGPDGNLVDPGIPLEEMALAAQEAELKLKGSPENIKQFRSLARSAEAAAEADVQAGIGPSGVTVYGQVFGPDTPLFQQLVAEGQIAKPKSLPFDELQGYSSELGKKIANFDWATQGGDVYQALKALKEKIDAAKFKVAERNGVGPQLQNAEAFWRDYQELLYDRESSLTKVREAVGVKNPSEMSAEFFRNKGNEIAVGRLKKLRSAHAADANAIADLTQNLNAAREEAAAYRATRQQQLPNRPKPGQEPAPLKPGEAPKPVVAATTPRRIIEGPTPPTAEEIVADKRARVENKAQSLMEISKYDAASVPVAIGGVLTGHPILGAVPLAAKYGLAFLLKRPSIVEWISQPTVRDLAAISKMPAVEQAALRSQLQAVMDQEIAGGRAIKPAGAVQNFMNRTTIVSRAMAIPSNSSAGVKNRREALQVLGQKVP